MPNPEYQMPIVVFSPANVMRPPAMSQPNQSKPKQTKASQSEAQWSEPGEPQRGEFKLVGSRVSGLPHAATGQPKGLPRSMEWITGQPGELVKSFEESLRVQLQIRVEFDLDEMLLP